MKNILILVLTVHGLLFGCVSNGVTIPEVSALNGNVAIVGSRTLHNGARIDAYVIAIDGQAVEHNGDYRQPIILEPGSYQITVETNQCHKANHTFSLTLEPNSLYVAQGTTVDYHTHEIWIADKVAGVEVTEKVRAKKHGHCSVVVPI